MPYADPQAGPHSFLLCHGFGCSHKTRVSLTSAQWKRVTAPLRKRVKDAADERLQVTKAVARMEVAVQEASGLNPDLGQARTFENDQAQMDCLDETINTARYLEFFAAEDLLHFHELAPPVHRGYFVDGLWPHNAAALKDLKTGQIYAIDSYYSDNGAEVYAVDLDVWLDEWRPPGLRLDAAIPKPPAKPPRI